MESSSSTLSFAVILSGCAFLIMVTATPVLFYTMGDMTSQLEAAKTGFEETSNVLWKELVTNESHRRVARQSCKRYCYCVELIVPICRQRNRIWGRRCSSRYCSSSIWWSNWRCFLSSWTEGRARNCWRTRNRRNWWNTRKGRSRRN